MHLQSALYVALSSAWVATAAYTLQDNCVGSTFQNCFDFYSGADPTNGFVR
jgi:hypothetical protein